MPKWMMDSEYVELKEFRNQRPEEFSRHFVHTYYMNVKWSK